MATVTARNRTRLIAAGAAVIVVAVLGILLTRDDGPDDSARPGERLDSLGVSIDDATGRWNAAITNQQVGDQLGDLQWELDEALALERAEQALDEWGLLELYRAPDGDLEAVDLVGKYVTDVDRSRFRADAVAALAAAADLDVAEALELLDGELGLADVEAELARTTDSNGLHVAVERSATTAQLRITAD